MIIKVAEKCGYQCDKTQLIFKTLMIRNEESR